MISYMVAAIDIVIASICLIISLYKIIYFDHGRKDTKCIIKIHLCLALLLIFDVASWYNEGRTSIKSIVLMQIGCFTNFFLAYVEIINFNKYMLCFLDEIDRFTQIFEHIIFFIGNVLCVLSVFSIWTGIFYYIDDANYYHRGDYFWLSYFLSGIDIVLLTINVLHNRKRYSKSMKLAFFFYLLFPVTFMIFQYINNIGMQLQSTGVGIAFMLQFMLSERETSQKIIEQQKQIILQQQKLIEKEQELSDMKMRLVESQMQPHFLYNVLNSIYILCDIDTERAKTAISEFSNYFRENSEAIATHGNIPFLKELQHVEGYLYLEKLRFGNKLQVKYDLSENGFMIPPLSLQPIVENAVKHGLGKKKKGGMINISSRYEDGSFVICVEDNGVGFDVNEPYDLNDKRSLHIGINNVKERIAHMCDGTVEVTSQIGVGTKVVITIPDKRGAKDGRE